MKINVYGIGNPLIDHIITIDESILQKLKIPKHSMQLTSVERQNEILSTVGKKEIKQEMGGSCANAIDIMAKLGLKVAYTGKVGNDEMGNFFAQSLKNSSVISFLDVSEGETGRCIILVTADAIRTMNTNLGACQLLDVQSINYDAIKSSQILFLEGYLIDTESQKEATYAALEYAKKHSITICVSLCDTFCVLRHKEDFEKIVKQYADIIIGNEAEGKILAQSDRMDDILKFYKQYIKYFSITQGKHGSTAYADGRTASVKAYPVKVIDTTGAGDVYTSFFYLWFDKKDEPRTNLSYCFLFF